MFGMTFFVWYWPNHARHYVFKSTLCVTLTCATHKYFQKLASAYCVCPKTTLKTCWSQILPSLFNILFYVFYFKIPSGTGTYSVGVIDSASLILVIEGEAEVMVDSSESSAIPVHRGSLLFTSANEKVSLNMKSSGMLMFQAYCQL